MPDNPGATVAVAARTSTSTGARRRAQFALVLIFLGTVGFVPISQVICELWRGERVQFTDVFRQPPTAGNLRQYEATLAEKSWIQKAARPRVQSVLFTVLGDTGAKALPGQDGWLFYRPDVRYLIEPDRLEPKPEQGRWVTPGRRLTQHENVAQCIRRFRDQLKARGTELLVVPVPGKPSVYPDRLAASAPTPTPETASRTRVLLGALQREGVATVDLFERFATTRISSPRANLYLSQDTHWTPLGARLAATAVADRLAALGWTPPAAAQFRTVPMSVQRRGDILEMLQLPPHGVDLLPGARETVVCDQVIDPAFGPLVPNASERPGVFRYPGQRSSILILGDSFCRIYQYPEPRSLGRDPNEPATTMQGAAGRQIGKRLLPGSAGFVSHLALALQAPVDAIVSDGGASTDVRRKLSTNPEILEGKRVVIWEFVERDIALGAAGWEDVPLPVELGR